MPIDKKDFDELLIRRNLKEIEIAKLKRKAFAKAIFKINNEIKELERQIKELEEDKECT